MGLNEVIYLLKYSKLVCILLTWQIDQSYLIKRNSENKASIIGKQEEKYINQ